MKTRILLLVPVAALLFGLAPSDKIIQTEVVVDASINDVWAAWTTEAGVISFFAPACHIDLRIDGAYEMYFNPSAPEGQRGGEGMRLLAIEAPHRLAFTWNAPTHLAEMRDQRTFVELKFTTVSATQTKVQLTHMGFGDGPQWDATHAYFTRAWGAIVLPFLQHRFTHGPIDWQNPPAITE